METIKSLASVDFHDWPREAARGQRRGAARREAGKLMRPLIMELASTETSLMWLTVRRMAPS